MSRNCARMKFFCRTTRARKKTVSTNKNDRTKTTTARTVFCRVHSIVRLKRFSSVWGSCEIVLMPTDHTLHCKISTFQIFWRWVAIDTATPRKRNTDSSISRIIVLHSG